MRRICSILILVLVFAPLAANAQKIFIPMDARTQTDHLKAYGIAYWVLTKNQTVDWLLNYRGGSFLTDFSNDIANECRIRGVAFETIDGSRVASIYSEVQNENNNMDVVKLEKAPKVAVYAPPGFLPWDDAVTLAMEYAEIKYDKIWDEDLMKDKLKEYDWLHLHHEDFTGQYGKFYTAYAGAPWYIAQVQLLESTAKKLGFRKVPDLKKAVVEKIREYIANGGFMFAMCTATETFDITQAARNTDIVDQPLDGDPYDPDCNSKLDYTRCFAFENFRVYPDIFQREHSEIDVDAMQLVPNQSTDYFTLFDFSAKYDPVPTMLTQCHVNVIPGFLGLATMFKKEFIKKSVTILGEKEGTNYVRYIHGNFGRGTFTWYGGHDPEDYQHAVGDP
ncbi:MAG: asparagine synthetase B, partial [Candidatus Kapabacteria bacterium]|nr:asparagine synthetase B [Candidatus Kapabacteria bacterium]